MYETWCSELDDWDSREYANDDLIDALYTVRLLQSPCRSFARLLLYVPLAQDASFDK